MVAIKDRLLCSVVGHAGHGKSTAVGHLLHASKPDSGSLQGLQLQAARDEQRSAAFARVRSTMTMTSRFTGLAVGKCPCAARRCVHTLQVLSVASVAVCCTSALSADLVSTKYRLELLRESYERLNEQKWC
jgi:translation elongation factor EF-1alpha